jgi:putative flippase GtrA
MRSPLVRYQRFLISSALSFGLNIAVTWLIHRVLGWSPSIAFGIALVTVFTANFFMLRHFVFEAAGGAAGHQAVRYVTLALAFRGAEYLAFLFAYEVIGIPYLLTAALVLATSALVKFFAYGNAVFNPGVARGSAGERGGAPAD